MYRCAVVTAAGTDHRHLSLIPSREVSRHAVRQQRVEVQQILLTGSVAITPRLHRGYAAVLDHFYLDGKQEILE